MTTVPCRIQNSAYRFIRIYYKIAMLYQWVLPPDIQFDKIKPLVNRFNLPPIIAKILYNRQIDTEEKAERFFNLTLDNLHDPF